MLLIDDNRENEQMYFLSSCRAKGGFQVNYLSLRFRDISPHIPRVITSSLRSQAVFRMYFAMFSLGLIPSIYLY